MHAIDLAELASTFVRSTQAQTALRLPPRAAAAQDYWLTARYRHDNWMHELTRHRHDIARAGASRRGRLWHTILPTIQEVLLSEPLTRALAYQASAWEHNTIDNELAPLALSTLAAHVEARNRCLHLIVFGQGLAVEDAVKLNRLRRTLEAYTDQLLSWLAPLDHPGLFAFDPDSLTKQQRLLQASKHSDCGLVLHTLALAEQLWRALHHDLDWRTGCARLNYQLSQNILGLLAQDSFDGLGLPRSARLARLEKPSLESTPAHPNQHPLFTPPPLVNDLPWRWSAINEPRSRLRDN